MTTHNTGTREEWLAARLELLKAEKEYSRQGDELARRRQELPRVRIDKEYRFDTDEGSASLIDLFRGRSQLLIYHFMFGPDWKAGCPSCSMIADAFNGSATHLANHDVMLWAVSRAPLSKLQAYKQRMGWTFPWAPSFSSDFNFDFNVWITEEKQREGAEYNYRIEAPTSDVFRWRPGQEGGGDLAEDRLAAACGVDALAYHRDRPGMSAFALEDGSICHAYSTYARRGCLLWCLPLARSCPQRDAMRRASGGVVTTSTTSAEQRRSCTIANTSTSIRLGKSATVVVGVIWPSSASRVSSAISSPSPISAAGAMSGW